MSYGDYVNGVLNKYGGELGRQTKFTIFLDIPRRVSLDYGVMTQFDILAKSVTLPNIKQDSIEMKYKGHDLKIPGRTNFDQVFSVTLYVDEYHLVRFALDNWIRLIDNQSISGENESISREDMYGRLKVSAKNFDEDEITREYDFHDVYPISVSTPEYSSEAQSSVQEVTIEFAYSFFESRESGGLNFKQAVDDLTYRATNIILDSVGMENVTVLNPTILRNNLTNDSNIFKKLKGNIW